MPQNIEKSQVITCSNNPTGHQTHSSVVSRKQSLVNASLKLNVSAILGSGFPYFSLGFGRVLLGEKRSL